jgi:CO dehydrogenase maturation factor
LRSWARLFTRFDLTVLVAEPTSKGISVYRRWQDYSEGFFVSVALVGNKEQTPDDLAFLRAHAAMNRWPGHGRRPPPRWRGVGDGRELSVIPG